MLLSHFFLNLSGEIPSCSSDRSPWYLPGKPAAQRRRDQVRLTSHSAGLFAIPIFDPRMIWPRLKARGFWQCRSEFASQRRTVAGVLNTNLSLNIVDSKRGVAWKTRYKLTATFKARNTMRKSHKKFIFQRHFWKATVTSRNYQQFHQFAARRCLMRPLLVWARIAILLDSQCSQVVVLQRFLCYRTFIFSF